MELIKKKNEFIKEFAMLMVIDSPYIVHLYGATLKSELCIVMEYCEKGSLDSTFKDPLFCTTWEFVFQIILEITAGIKFLHDFDPSILHRDLKTSNVLVTSESHCKIADFGLSRFDTSANLSTLHKCRGTFAYMPPEGYISFKYTQSSDIYSIAIIMWETINRCVKGKYELPYQEYNYNNEFLILKNVHDNNLRPTIPNIPTELKTLLQRSWSQERDDRPTSIDLINQIDQFLLHCKSNPEEWNIFLPKTE